MTVPKPRSELAFVDQERLIQICISSRGATNNVQQVVKDLAASDPAFREKLSGWVDGFIFDGKANRVTHLKALIDDCPLLLTEARSQKASRAAVKAAQQLLKNIPEEQALTSGIDHSSRSFPRAQISATSTTNRQSSKNQPLLPVISPATSQASRDRSNSPHSSPNSTPALTPRRQQPPMSVPPRTSNTNATGQARIGQNSDSSKIPSQKQSTPMPASQPPISSDPPASGPRACLLEPSTGVSDRSTLPQPAELPRKTQNTQNKTPQPGWASRTDLVSKAHASKPGKEQERGEKKGGQQQQESPKHHLRKENLCARTGTSSGSDTCTPRSKSKQRVSKWLDDSSRSASLAASAEDRAS